MSKDAKGLESVAGEHGRNVTLWFPDAAVADRATELAAELKTSVSALVFEVVSKALPVIERNKRMRVIPLDGVQVNV